MKKSYLYKILLVSVLAMSISACSFDEELNDIDAELSEMLDEDFENIDADEEKDTTDESNTETDADVEESVESDIAGEYPVGQGANISFDTVDVNDNPVGQDMLKDARIVLLNLWEPWCGPCVNEMPDLNYLYESYKDKGLLVIGAYSTFDMDADARELVQELDITYPIIKCNEAINGLEQNYVPATYLLDRDGNLITEEPFAGAQSYEGWEEVISEYLE